VVSVIVLTYNRMHLLRQCVEKVLFRTSDLTTELLVWDNASSDGTAEYLDSLDDARLKVVHHPENIGQNAYARAVPLTSTPYFIELDDDVIEGCSRRSNRSPTSGSSRRSSRTTGSAQDRTFSTARRRTSIAGRL
jgi:GT2 family glycosyltransferase